MSEYPIQVEKVHAPPLRDDVIARERLLDWLEAKVQGRVTLVIAEAGYGKTTLLADFARRTSLPVAWYRLDRGDRDWVGFVAHLVAALRVHGPELGANATGLLRQTGSSAPPRDVVIDALIRDLGDIPLGPQVLVLDDYHTVDGSEDVSAVLEELIARAPARLHLVIGSRRTPRLRLAKLRAQGEFSELGRDQLKFDRHELVSFLGWDWTGANKEALRQLEARTEGWPASLQLVKTAALDRDDAGVQALVKGLDVESPIYDYLAEEVVSGLPPDLQDFLMRVSVLETVTPEVASVVGEMSIEDSSRLIAVGRDYGLLGTIAAAHGAFDVRAHPLVRTFLQDRLASQYPKAKVDSLHLAAARVLEHSNWRVACLHYLAASDAHSAVRVVTDHLAEILGTGTYYSAAGILTKAGASSESVAALVIGARVALQQGNAAEAVALANRAQALAPTSPEVAATVMSTRNFAGDVVGAIEAARQLETEPHALSRDLARTYRLVLSTSVAGPLDDAERAVEGLLANPDHAANPRYAGITLTNLAYILKGRGEAQKAIRVSSDALEMLAGTAAVIEQVSARLARGWGLAHVGDLEGARQEVAEALSHAPVGQRVEVASELAEIELYYGKKDRAVAALELSGESSGEARDQASLVLSQLLAAEGSFGAADAELGTIEPLRLRTSVAFEARRQITVAYLAWSRGSYSEAAAAALGAAKQARNQGAHLWERYARILAAVAVVDKSPSATVHAVGTSDPSILSMAADLLLKRIDDLDHAVLELLEIAVERHPERWRDLLRRHALGTPHSSVAQTWLARVGDVMDVALLSDLARAQKSAEVAGLAKSLARRLASEVFVLDLGRLRIRVGKRLVDGSSIRRKVLALLSYLITKPDLSASREDVCEALWPDLDPADAMNSLNQTAYFLRRLFEPTFKESTSPGYLHQDGETIWLDPELVFTQSRECRSLIAAMSARPSLGDASRLLDLYAAPFALDFAYEDWAARYREPLHATVLRVIEQAIRRAASAHERAQAIAIAERAIVVEPEAESIQAALIGLYRSVGAHTAAAEQYELYRGTLHGLGVDAPPIGEVG